MTSPTIKRLYSPRSSREIARKIVSCTSLLSWYSSIMISLKLSRNSSAVFLILPVSSSTKIFNAKCSRSWKSTRFFRRFSAVNVSSNSNVRRTNSAAIGAVFFICSAMISGDVKKYWRFIFLTASFPISRSFLTSSNFSSFPSNPREEASLS